MLKVIEMLLVLFGTPPETCISTMFGTPGDKWVGGEALYLGRRVNQTDPGIAHRTLPLGSIVLVRNERTQQIAIVPVIDRGPYGAMHDGSWLVKKRASDPGRWRGCADLTPATASLVGHDGWDRVTLFLIVKGEKQWRKTRWTTRKKRSTPSPVSVTQRFVVTTQRLVILFSRIGTTVPSG